MACEPRYETKSLIAKSFQQRGIIRDSVLLNPCPDRSIYTFEPNASGKGCNCGEPQYSGSTITDLSNWYKNYLPFAIRREAPKIDTEPPVFSKIQAQHIRGPSVGEGQAEVYPWIYIRVYANDYQESQDRGIGYLPNITEGRGAGAGGPVTGVGIDYAGSQLDNRIDGWEYNLQSNTGTGGKARISLSGGRISSVQLTAAGDNYQVGDTTTGIKYSPAFSPDPQSPGSIKVTSIDDSNINPDLKLNWWIVDPRDCGNTFDAGDGNFLSATDGYAIGDEFQINVTNLNQFSDQPAVVRVTAIDVTNTVESTATLSYTVEKGVGLVWTQSDLDRTVDLVIDYDRNVTDQVLLASADLCFQEFLAYADRKPTDLEFEYFTKQIYNNDGVISDEWYELFFETVGDEVYNRLLAVTPECDRIALEDELANQAPDGGDCVWDRNDFYQGAGNSAGYNIQLKHLWDFLGQPAGPSRAGEGASIGELECPKPESGQIQDQEPDISDFAGMRLWRWTECTPGSDLGGYQEIEVPCPGPEEGCENPTVEEDNVLYDVEATLTWNNGESLRDNFFKETLPGANELVFWINWRYELSFDRPPTQSDVRRWIDVAEATESTQYAEYFTNAKVEWPQNDSFTLQPLVKQTYTANAFAINSKYFELFDRPAEKAGMEYWANEADSIGIENTLANIEAAAVTELSWGPNYWTTGLDRVWQMIDEEGDPERARGGVDSFKLFCQSQVSKQINLEYFKNTRVPPKYGSLSSTAPQISAVELSDTNWLRYNPANQTELVGSFTSNTGPLNFKFQMSQKFNVNWGTVTGDLYGDERQPRIEKAVRATLYSVYNGSGDIPTGIDFVEYSDPNLRDSAGNYVLRDYVGIQPNGAAGCSGVYGGQINVSRIEDSLTVVQPTWGYCNLASPNSNNQLAKDDADSIAFNESPYGGNRWFWRMEVYYIVLDPDTLEVIPGLTKSDVFLSRTDSQTMRFFSAYSTSNECPNGTKICPNGDIICVENNCPDQPPTNDCNSLSISCGGDNNLEVETNKPTTVRFSYRVNNANRCSTKGSAKVSIRRYWPCPIFGPAPGAENAWVKDENGADIVKRSVSIVNGEAIYDLRVNTTKDDYLATSYGDQTVDDPGNCHWVYVAYWEIEGMSGTSIRCNSTAWENPGCYTNTGAFTQLPEVLCIQKQNCSDDGLDGLTGRDQVVQVPTGAFTELEALNPYPDPRLVRTLPQSFPTGYPSGPGDPNPASLTSKNWNWYYDCPSDPVTANSGDTVPAEDWSFTQITGNGKGGTITTSFTFYDAGFTNGPDGRVDMTKGCVDSGGDFVQLFVNKVIVKVGEGNGGDGYAVGDILEWRPKNMDPESTPFRFRVKEINPTSTAGDCSQADWANEFDLSEMDPNQNCLPYCSTSGKQTFYWNAQITAIPGENCSGGGSGSGSRTTNLLAADCSDCPVCEQTIKVTIGDTTSCGALDFPGMREDGAGLGINNGSFKIGNRTIKDPNAAYPTIDTASLKLYTKTNGAKWIPISVANWVTIAPATTNSLVTKGIDNAVIFGETDFAALKEICCDGTDCINQGTNWDCQDYCPQGLCYDELDDTPLVDCNGKMRAVAQWYWKLTYKNSETQILPMPFYENWDTPDEQQVRLIDTDYYPDSAGNNTNGVPMSYFGEISNGSYFEGRSSTYLPYSNELRKVEIYLKIQASNDEFGNERYHPPPSGFNERDFGTDKRISSNRFPYQNSPKPEVFLVGGFEIGDTANLPVPLDDWSMELTGCESAQVWTPRYTASTGDYYCGDPNSDNFYAIRRNSNYKSSEEFGKVNGVEFVNDCYLGCSCKDSGQTTSKNFNHVTGEGQDCPRSFCPEYYSPDFADCWPVSSAKLKVVGNITSVDNRDYVRQPLNPNTGVKLVWYVNGKVVSKGAIGGASTNSPNQTCFFADREEYWEDVCAQLTDENETYTVTVYALINNRQNVLKEGPPGDADGYSILQRGDRVAPMSLTTKNNDGETPVVLPPLPLGENVTWLDGDAFQVILGTATCTIKGNNGSGSKDLTGLQAPQFNITVSGNNFSGSSTISLPGGGTIDCNPDCCNDANPGTNCGEAYDALLALCGDALCGGTNSGSGTLTATVTNLPQAWPTIPGTSDRVTGTVKYQWAKESNTIGQFVDIPGATEKSIAYVADGKKYRCTVTFDLAGKVPSGYKAKPEKSSSSKIYNSENIDLQDCNGVLIPIDQPCNDDPVSPCIEPKYGLTDIDIRTINAFKPGESGTPYASITVKNNTTPTIVASPLVQGMTNNTLVRASARLLKNGQVAGVLTDMDVVFGQGDIYTFNVSFPVTGSNETANFGARYVIDYKCPDGVQKQAIFRDPKTASITWNTTGDGNDDGGDDEFPFLKTLPQCYYTNDKINSQNCGSYLGEWVDFAGAPPKLYYQNARSTRIEDRGALFNNNAQQNARCDFCPPADCPSLNITRVNQSPTDVKKNQEVSLSVTFTSDLKGFEPTNPGFGSTTYVWEGEGITPSSIGNLHTATIKAGPYTTDGVRNCKVTVNQFYSDPNGQCGPSDAILNFKAVSDTYEFTINVGGGGPVDPDPVKPTISGTISGDSSLTLNNGSVVGNYVMTYNLNEGVGYQPSTREVTVGWDGGTPLKYESQGGKNYSRTFEQVGSVSVVGKVAKLFAKPGYDGPLDSDSIIAADNADPGCCKYWISDPNIIFPVNVSAEGGPETKPTLTMNVTANKTNIEVGDTVRFTASASINNGTYTPTSEPYRLTYDVVNGTFSGAPYLNNVLSKTWDRTFTSAGSFDIKARIRRNYCAEGLNSCANTDSSNVSFFEDDSVNITVTDPTPTGTKPNAVLLAPEYYDNNSNQVAAGPDGCAFVFDNRVPVNVVFKIRLDQGTGDFVYGSARVLDGNGNPDGRWTQQSVGGGNYQLVRSDVNVRVTSGNRLGGFRVRFYSDQFATQEIHTMRVGQVDWCVEVESTQINPFDPNGPQIDLQ